MLWGCHYFLKTSKSIFQMPDPKSNKDILLAPVGTFEAAVRKILGNSKKDSDKQLATFQASNARKRAAKKRN